MRTRHGQRLEDLMDSLRENGCPEEEIYETAEYILAEERLPERKPNLLSDPNPYWEKIIPDIEAEFEENMIGPVLAYNPEFRAFTRCSIG